MRKSLFLFVLLAAILLGGTGFIHGTLNAVKDQVTYEENITYGDSSVADGLTVKNNVQFAQKLFWDTTYEAGTDSKTTTDFRFYTVNQPSEFFQEPYAQLDSFWGSYSSSGNEYPRIIEDLVAKTRPGETVHEKVYLKDYYDYYPISFNIQIGDSYYEGWDAFYLENNEGVSSDTLTQAKAFNDFLRIPLVSSHSMELEVMKDSSGNISFTSSSQTDEEFFQFNTWSVVTKEAIYFTFDAHTTKNNLVDTSLIPGGYGIYRLPYKTLEGTFTCTIDTNQLSMVYSLNPENTISSMDLTKDESRILLFSTDEENTGSQLIVIDATTHETAQILKVPGIPLEAGVTEILHVSDSFIAEDFAAYSCSGDYIVLFTTSADGTLNLEFINKTYPDPNFYYWIHSESYMDWDGERLAVASPNGFCDFSLAIYDKTGLLYFSSMQSSLSKGGHSYNQGYIMNQETKEPFLTVEWTK